MREPFWQTTYEYHQLLEHERILQFADRFRLLRQAAYMTFAFNEPQRIRDEQQRAMEDAGLVPSIEEALTGAQQTIAAMHALDAQGRAGHPAPADPDRLEVIHGE